MVYQRPISEFSDRELLRYADDHVLYEITHFIRAAQAIDAARSGVFPMNFAIEVFALHLRNLLDFFAPRSERKTDARAKNFHREWQSPKLNLYLEEARWMADKHVAHLTTDRTTDADLKEWAIEPILHSMIPIIERFSSEAELVSDYFRESVADRIAEAPPKKNWTNLPPQPSTATEMARDYPN